MIDIARNYVEGIREGFNFSNSDLVCCLEHLHSKYGVPLYARAN